MASLNAQARKYPEGYLILINDGLDVLVTLYQSILYRSENFQKMLHGKAIGTVLYDEETELEMMATIFCEFLFHGEISIDRAPALFNNLITAKDGIFCKYFLLIKYEFTAFVCAHELGHILCGHMSDVSTRKMTTYKGLMDVPVHDWLLEFHADRFAAILLYNPNRNRVKSGPPLSNYADHLTLSLILSSIVLFFQLAELVDFLAKKFTICLAGLSLLILIIPRLWKG